MQCPRCSTRMYGEMIMGRSAATVREQSQMLREYVLTCYRCGEMVFENSGIRQADIAPELAPNTTHKRTGAIGAKASGEKRSAAIKALIAANAAYIRVCRKRGLSWLKTSETLAKKGISISATAMHRYKDMILTEREAA